jgi:hypothetical protein
MYLWSFLYKIQFDRLLRLSATDPDTHTYTHTYSYTNAYAYTNA